MLRFRNFGVGLWVAACCVWAPFCCLAGAQSTITGRLLQKRGESVYPVRHCTVYASSADHGPLVGEYPDQQGRFRLDFPSASRITVGTICPGFRLFGGPANETIEVSGEPMLPPRDCSNPGPCAEVQLLVEPLAVIEGELVDDNGIPAEGIRLGLRQQAAGPGARVYTAVSDDRGYFRFFHLPPGAYELLRFDRSSQPTETLENDPRRLTVGPGDVVSTGPIRLPSTGPVVPAVPTVRSLESPPDGQPGQPDGAGATASSLVSDGVVVARVRDSLGNPVVGAVVFLLGSSAANEQMRRRAASDAAGLARFPGLPNGTFGAEVYMAGFSLGRSGLHWVDLKGPNAEARLEFSLRRRPVLTGRVIDEQGTPMPDTRVQLYSLTTGDGVEMVSPGMPTTTDDRGSYRISVPEPGRFWVMATHMEASFPLGSAPRPTGSVFYPNSPDLLSAQPADLAFDQPETTFDITLPPAPRTGLAAGLLAGADGRPCARCAYSLRRVEGAYDYELIGEAISGRLPGFEYRGIPPGHYRIYVEEQDGDSLGWWAIEDVMVAEDRPVALTITTQPPVAVAARLTLEDPPLGWIAENRERADAVQVQLTQVGDSFFTLHRASTARTELSPDETEFRLGPMPPARFRLQVWVQGADAYLAAVARQGRGVPSPLLDFSQPGAWTNLELRVRFDMARPVIRIPAQTTLSEGWTMHRIVLVPDPQQNPFGHYMEGYCGPDGACEISPLPPGRYWAVVFFQQTAEGLDFRDPQVRNKLARWGREIDVTPGENPAIELKPVPQEALKGI